jgi:pimeloyl-ACP methyl ester carboxylesterase
MAHYLFEPLKKRNRALLGLNTRYVANDTMLSMERAVQDLGAGVKYLREVGYKKIILIGNSGGGALAAMYQEQAENLTITTTPDGRPIDIEADDLLPVDGIAMLCAHPGRAHTLTDWIDPALVDEKELLSIDPELDMYNPDNGPAYKKSWLNKYRIAQRARNERLTDWVLDRLTEIKGSAASDQAFIIHRTMADPRFLDLSLDPNDREPGTIWGDPKAINYAANNIGRFTTLRSFLSQWSIRLSRADGPKCLSNTTIPILNVNYTADKCVFPSQLKMWSEAAKERCTDYSLKDVGHYPHDKPEKINEVANLLIDWANTV